MAIRSSPTRDVARLLGELASGDALRRESAAARLIIIGAPVSARVAALASDLAASPDARQAALHTLAGIDPARAAAIAADAVGDPADGLSLEAIDVLAAVARGDTTASTAAFARLTGVAFDPRQPARRRLAVLSALRGLPAHLLTPIDNALAGAEGRTAFGDPDCLGPLAGAWTAAADGDKAWRDRLAALFGAIVARENLTRDHPALVAVLKAHPAAAVLVAAAPKARRRSSQPE
jgi:hypothetical protein